jgi:hypothetical protein
MELWQTMLDTALLGTDKRQAGTESFPPALAEAVALISHTDREEQFLQTAALAFNYRQCGVQPLQKEGVSIDKAGAEEKAYCSALSMQVLKDILSAESIPLLNLWLQQCAVKEQVVQPDLLPEILTIGEQYKKLQPTIATCAGKRGVWLSRFNRAWSFSTTATDKELWQTGTPEQRKVVLIQERATNPDEARAWLQETWAQEDANTKTELLALLVTNIGEADIVFLESLGIEKSKKVKDMALKLLKLIPSSAIVQQYLQVLQQAVTLKKEKSLLGMVSKTVLQVQLPSPVDEAIFKTGIDKLSNSKELTDDEFIIFQLAQVAPPLFWEQQLNLEPAAIIDLLQKDKSGKKLLPAIIQALVNAKDERWALSFMQYSETFYLDILPLLPVKQQEYYSLKFFDQHADSIINYAAQRTDEWSLELTRRIIQHAAKNPYQYNRAFFNQQIQRIPATIVRELNNYKPEVDYQQNSWNNISTYIIELIRLKTQTLQSFNALN